MLESGNIDMARRYLDEVGIVQLISPFDMYDLAAGNTYESANEVVPGQTVVPITNTPTRRVRKTSKKKDVNNSNIIRNHDSVWDYKIDNGKLLTRRKGNKSWIDISDNEEAVSRIQKFTGKTISQSKSQKVSEPSRTPEGGLFGGKTYDELNTILESVYSENNSTSNKQSIKSTKGIDTNNFVIRNEFKEPYRNSDNNKKWLARNIPITRISNNIINRNIGYSIPTLGDALYNQVWGNKVDASTYIRLMNMLGIDPMAKGNERYYPMI